MDGCNPSSCCWRLPSTPQCPPALQLRGLSTAGTHGACQNCSHSSRRHHTAQDITVQGQPAITSGSSARLQHCYAVGPQFPVPGVLCAWGRAPAAATEGCRSTSAPSQTAMSTESPADRGCAHAWEAAGTSRGPREDACHRENLSPAPLGKARGNDKVRCSGKISLSAQRRPKGCWILSGFQVDNKLLRK